MTAQSRTSPADKGPDRRRTKCDFRNETARRATPCKCVCPTMTAMNGTPRGDRSNDPGAAALTLTHAEPVAMRVGDDERNAAAAALGEHLTAGRIDLNEYGQRSAQAFAAHTEVDLQGLFRDLPAPHPLAAGPTNPSGQISTPRSAAVPAQTGVLPGR